MGENLNGGFLVNVTGEIPAGMTSFVFRIPCNLHENEGYLTDAFGRVLVCRMIWKRSDGGGPLYCNIVKK